MFQPISSPYSRAWRLGTIRAVVASALLIGCGGIEDPDPMTGGPDAGTQVDEPDAMPDPDPTPDAGVDPGDPDAAPTECAEGHTGAGCLDCDTGYQDQDGNGVCAPACDATGPLALDCGAHGDCNDATGARICECDTGYGGASCEFCTAGFESDGNGNCILDLPTTTGMTLWLDANQPSSLIRTATNKVLEWRDRRGGINPVILFPPAVSAQASWIFNGMNGRGAVRFDGNDSLRAPGFAGLNAADYTLFIVYSPSAQVPETLMRLTHLEFGTSFIVDRFSQGYYYRATHRSPPGATGGDVVQAQFTELFSDKLLVLGRATSGSVDFMRLIGNAGGDLAGAEGINATLSNPNLSGSLTLDLGAASASGDIAEVIAYNRLLTQNELTNVQEYLAAKWNLQ